MLLLYLVDFGVARSTEGRRSLLGLASELFLVLDKTVKYGYMRYNV